MRIIALGLGIHQRKRRRGSNIAGDRREKVTVGFQRRRIQVIETVGFGGWVVDNDDFFRVMGNGGNRVILEKNPNNDEQDDDNQKRCDGL